jgi:hypothetical protein
LLIIGAVFVKKDIEYHAVPYKFCFGYNEAIPHWHEHVELLYFQGDGTFICDREEYTVKAGDLAVFNSNDVHAVSLRDGFFYDCLIVDSTFLAKNDIDVTALRFTPHIRDEMAEKLFANIALSCSTICTTLLAFCLRFNFFVKFSYLWPIIYLYIRR